MVRTVLLPGRLVENKGCYAMVLWDSHPELRLGHIIQSGLRRHHFFLRNYFLNVNPPHCTIAETFYCHVLADDSLAILFTSYMDNTYSAFCNVPVSLHGAVRHFVFLLQDTLYQVPFK